MYTSIYVYIHINVCTSNTQIRVQGMGWQCIFRCIYVFKYICVYVYTCVYVSIYMYTYISIYLYKYLNIYIYIYVCRHIFIHLNINFISIY